MRRTALRTASPVLLPDTVDDVLVDGRVVTPKAPARTDPTVSVIIPTLNEAGNLPYVLNTIPRWVDEVLIIDGRSSDDTARVAKVLRPDARIVHQPNKGKGAAMRAGLDAAHGDILILMDADGSMDGAEVELFRDALVEGAGYVKGSRFRKGGGSTDITRLRRFGDWGICLLMRVLFGARYTDGTYGYKGMWASNLDVLRPDKDGFDAELIIDIRAHRAGLKIAEVPCFETNRIHGASNLNAFRDGFVDLRIILRERFRKQRVPST